MSLTIKLLKKARCVDPVNNFAELCCVDIDFDAGGI